MALIDPSYEEKKDYQQVVSTVLKIHKRWPVGVLALWYPLLARQRDHSEWLASALTREALPHMLLLELTVRQQAEEFGMYGSGMLLINTPWQFREEMQATLSTLVGVLGPQTSFRIAPLSSFN